MNESIEIIKTSGKRVETIVSIGGGAKSREWLQIQADVFDTSIEKLKNEQGPGMGAAMLAACGCSWFDSLEQCSNAFKQVEVVVEPRREAADQYRELFSIYQDIYQQTKEITGKLKKFRK